MYSAGYNRGLGFEETFSDVDTSSGPMFDPTNWDWHEWALVAIAGWVLIRGIGRGAQSAKRAVGRKVKKVKSAASRRKRALKQVITG